MNIFDDEYEERKMCELDQSYFIQHQLDEQNSEKNKNSLSIDSFHLLSIIGKGSYAKVALVRKKDTGEIFALKILKKSYIEYRDQKHRVLEERKVLEETKNQFVVKMKYAFQNEEKLFFVLEYCPGGELFNILNKRHFFSNSQTQFYTAQIILALEYLHSKNIIYRDLKPENVLIDAQGYIKLTDFGLSKRNISNDRSAKSICGTPEYLAPEILFKEGHGKMVDFWTLGAIVYEMFVGQPPFNIDQNQKRENLFEKIKYEPVQFPPKVQGTLRDFLERLLEKVPSKRLGSKHGCEELKNHPWFQNFNWDKLKKKEIDAPFQPILNHDTELTYFAPEFLDIPFQSPPGQEKIFVESQNSQKQDQDQNYSMFTYIKSETNSQYSPTKLSPKEALKSQEYLYGSLNNANLSHNQNNRNSYSNNNIINSNHNLQQQQQQQQLSGSKQKMKNYNNNNINNIKQNSSNYNNNNNSNQFDQQQQQQQQINMVFQGGSENYIVEEEENIINNNNINLQHKQLSNSNKADICSSSQENSEQNLDNISSSQQQQCQNNQMQTMEFEK